MMSFWLIYKSQAGAKAPPPFVEWDPECLYVWAIYEIYIFNFNLHKASFMCLTFLKPDFSAQNSLGHKMYNVCIENKTVRALSHICTVLTGSAAHSTAPNAIANLPLFIMFWSCCFTAHSVLGYTDRASGAIRQSPSLSCNHAFTATELHLQDIDPLVYYIFFFYWQGTNWPAQVDRTPGKQVGLWVLTSQLSKLP